MENLRPILWLSLVFILFLMWQTWKLDYGPSAPLAQDRIEEAQRALAEGAPQDVPEAAQIPELVASERTSADFPNPGGFQEHSSVVKIRTDRLELDIDLRGGTILRADLLAFPVDLKNPDVPVRLFDQQRRAYVAQSGLTHERVGELDVQDRAPNHHAAFMANAQHFEMAASEATLRVPLYWTSEDGTVRVIKTYILERGSHLIRLEHEIQNLSDTPWVGRQYRQLRHGPTPDRESFFLYTFTGAAYYDGRYNKESFESLASSPLQQRLEGGWISILEHYFMTAWIPEANESSMLYGRGVPGRIGTDYLIGLHSAEPLRVNPGETGYFNTQLWIGPKAQAELQSIAKGLELTVDYGIFTFLAKPLFWLLRVINDFVGNWGWSIIFLTILIKLAFFHLSATSYRSMAKMRAVAPKLQAMKERYKDDKQRMNEALMDLYRKEKINPLGGCLPILIQIPVFIALYWTLLESVEMRQAPWILWITDLSTRDPWFILPLLMGVTMFIQYKLNPPPADPIQQKLFMALPFVFTIFFAFFPSGLVLYWFTNNLFSIAQQYVITRKIDADYQKK
jgi:YidC/Oxa1 family membrane protein insertase